MAPVYESEPPPANHSRSPLSRSLTRKMFDMGWRNLYPTSAGAIGTSVSVGSACLCGLIYLSSPSLRAWRCLMWRTVYCLIAVSLILAGVSQLQGAQTLFLHTGSNDPTTEGWLDTDFFNPNGVQAG